MDFTNQPQQRQLQSGNQDMSASARFASPTMGAFSNGGFANNGGARLHVMPQQPGQSQGMGQLIQNSWAGPTQSGTAVGAAQNGASQYDPRLVALYQQYGKQTGERGSGFGDIAYWNDHVKSDGWDYINGRLGANLAGHGTDMPGPGDAGNTSGQGQYAQMGNQMGAPSMQNIMQLLQMMQGGQIRPTYAGSMQQQQPQLMKANTATSLVPGGFGPSNYGSQMQDMGIGSFLGR